VGGRVVAVAVTHDPARRRLRARCDLRLEAREAAAVRAGLKRMLRVGFDVKPWHRLEPQAKRRGFGRLFRGASLFEDIVRTMTSCNVAWPNTVRMNLRLCELVGDGAFPTPSRLAAWEPHTLQARCRVGYRAARIVALARAVCDGRLDLEGLEDPARPTPELRDELLRIPGVGPYSANNILQLLGRFEHLPIDSETYRHFHEVHRLPQPQTATERRELDLRIRSHYDRYAPYQFLAYWFELMRGYEGRAGHVETWPQANSNAFTAKGP
jgi:3-methyladenine DNA glycosylase/8-oxoguanine DNA glycosylase